MKKSLLLILSLLFCTSSFSQDPHFTQYYANPLFLNPALAGGEYCPRIITNYRNQWPMMAGNFETYSASFDLTLDPIHGGLGLLILHDDAGNGTIKSTFASLIYSYHTKITNKIDLLTGFQLSSHQRSLDPDLWFGDQIDGIYGFVYDTQDPLNQGIITNNYLDFSIGTLISSNSFFLGFAAHHLTEPEEAFLSSGKLSMKKTVHGGAVIKINGAVSQTAGLFSGDTYLIPNFLFKQQAQTEQINIGTTITNNILSGGVAYRRSFANSDALLFVLGFQKDALRIGYSYDFTISGLSNYSGGAHEISLRIQLPCIPKKIILNPIKCPKF